VCLPEGALLNDGSLSSPARPVVKRYTPDVDQNIYDLGTCMPDEYGEYVLHAEATDIIAQREEQILRLTHERDLAQARVRALETLLETTLSAWETYQNTKGPTGW
jgi:hypothetical protein